MIPRAKAESKCGQRIFVADRLYEYPEIAVTKWGQDISKMFHSRLLNLA
jgi:hypothetical protein